MTYWHWRRGNEIISEQGKPQRYTSDGVKVKDDPERSCIRCGRPPLPEGYDACVGHIPGAISVCCGHGIEEPIMMMTILHE